MSNWKVIAFTALFGVALAASIALLVFVAFALGDTIFVTGKGL